jgi:hypothetical protein
VSAKRTPGSQLYHPGIYIAQILNLISSHLRLVLLSFKAAESLEMPIKNIGNCKTQCCQAAMTARRRKNEAITNKTSVIQHWAHSAGCGGPQSALYLSLKRQVIARYSGSLTYCRG